MRLWSYLPLPVKAVIAAGASALAWVIAIQVATAKPGHSWSLGPIEGGARVWLTVGAVLTVVAVGIPLVDQYVADRTALAETTKRIFAINSVITPCAKLLAQLTDKNLSDREKETRRGELKAYILAGLKELLKDSGDIQSSYLVIVEGATRALEIDGQYGRGASTTIGSTLGKGAVDYLMKVLDKGDPWVCPNTRRDMPVGWGQDPGDSRSLIVVPVTTPSRVYGLLMVDSPVVKGLRESDTPVVTLFSQLLATAMNA